MKITEVDTKSVHVEMHYTEGIGYSVIHRDGTIEGYQHGIKGRLAAESIFRWAVGYPEWQQASDLAFKIARDNWLEEHGTLESVGASDLRP